MLRPSGLFISSSAFRCHSSFTSSSHNSVAKNLTRHSQLTSPLRHCLPNSSHSRRCLLVAAAVVLTSSTFSPTTTSVRAYSPSSFGSMPFITERTGDGIITVSPKDESKQSALVVISHGLGDTSEGFADVAEVRYTHMHTHTHKKNERPGCVCFEGIIMSILTLSFTRLCS
jgi:hypothetical protein